jgi:hypothetical protein
VRDLAQQRFRHRYRIVGTTDTDTVFEVSGIGQPWKAPNLDRKTLSPHLPTHVGTP